MRAANPSGAGGLGRGVARTAGGTLGVATLAFGAGLLTGHAQLAFGALAAGWLISAGVASGAVAVTAVVRVAQGRWAVRSLPIGEAVSGFFIGAWVLLAALMAGARFWMPGQDELPLGDTIWMASRDLGLAALLFWVGHRYLKRAHREKTNGPTTEAIVYLLLYAVTLSVWAMDLVMGLHDWAPSTIIPAFYFMSCFLGGLAWIALVGSLKSEGPEPSERHDLGKMLFGFVFFWAYLLWAAFLPVWYGNLPDEMGQFQVRWEGGWRLISSLVLVALAVPFLLLFPEATKRRRATLGVGAASVLLGLFVEGILLVIPSLPPVEGATGVAVALVTALGPCALLVLTSSWAREPQPS